MTGPRSIIDPAPTRPDDGTAAMHPLPGAAPAETAASILSVNRRVDSPTGTESPAAASLNAM